MKDAIGVALGACQIDAVNGCQNGCNAGRDMSIVGCRVERHEIRTVREEVFVYVLVMRALLGRGVVDLL